MGDAHLAFDHRALWDAGASRIEMHEFLERQDCRRPLSARYALGMRDVRGVDHALGYAVLTSRSIDMKDAYSTDAKIAESDLVVFEDDAQFFPQYQAVFLDRLDLDPQ